MLASVIFVTFTIAVCAYFIFTPTSGKVPSGTQLPDGPSGKPIIDNLLDIPPRHSWFKFPQWSKQYGPLFRLDIAGRNHIVVSTEEIANDLLRERGTIYSDREQLPMAAKLLSDNLRPLFLPYGGTWRNVRKLMHKLTNISVATTYETLQEEESLRTFERYSAGLILRLAYSKPVYTGEDSFVKGHSLSCTQWKEESALEHILRTRFLLCCTALLFGSVQA
ncbi:uncharacterized protein Z518_08978 [Rhinocladiella mackenziei CBS 650.93]|uniref:Cytochrome P450 n=1 Tax=Rhinocladiella mackenziei CBS 650.93 TaxID=1442369 RepID=A0A0D2GSD2_9EURO|nr:uncharacterized protein Z518_08978 [Rhinocladiella mackenziei CBS 650.93]KIX01253.1 hypothetical protein Z518_08978 [Rhinocladiella mackenziei CBS 650.93]